MSIEQTAYLTRMSLDLVNKYRALHARLIKIAADAGSLDTRHPGGVK
jgi:hypothetical protein